MHAANTWSHFDSYEWISTCLVWEYAAWTDYVLTMYCVLYVCCTGCCTVDIWCRRCAVTCYCGMCRMQCMGVIPCHTSRAEPGLAPLIRGIDHRPSILPMCYGVTVHGCHTSRSRAEPGLSNTHPRNQSLYVFLSQCMGVIPAERNQGSQHLPEELIIDHRFSICCTQYMGVIPAERNQSSHHSPEESIIDHRFSLCYCVTLSQCMSVIACHTSRAEPKFAPLTLGINHWPSILDMCYYVIVHGCHTSKVEPGLTPYTRVIDHRPSILSMRYCVTVHGCHSGTRAQNTQPM